MARVCYSEKCVCKKLLISQYQPVSPLSKEALIARMV